MRPPTQSHPPLFGALFRTLGDLWFPARCAVCSRLLDTKADPPAAEPARSPGDGVHMLCETCRDDLPRVGSSCCSRCGLPLPASGAAPHACGDCLASPPAFDRARSILRYAEPARSAILAYKHSGRRDLGRLFVSLLAMDESLCGDARPPYDVVVPVPLHPWKLWRRGFNQALSLAVGLGRRTRLPVDRDGLRKCRSTPAQSSLPREMRTRNLRRAFRPRRPGLFRGKKILLIDDVMTTGATLDACARALKDAGAERVEGLTVARTA